MIDVFSMFFSWDLRSQGTFSTAIGTLDNNAVKGYRGAWASSFLSRIRILGIKMKRIEREAQTNERSGGGLAHADPGIIPRHSNREVLRKQRQ